MPHPRPDPCAWCRHPARGVASHPGEGGIRVVMTLCPGCLEAWSAIFGTSTLPMALEERLGRRRSRGR